MGSSSPIFGVKIKNIWVATTYPWTPKPWWKNEGFKTPNIWVITRKNEGNVGSHGSQSNITQQSTGDFSRKNPELPHLRLEPSTQRWYSRFLQPYRQQPDGSKGPKEKPRLQKIDGSNFETKIYIYTKPSFFGEVERIKIIFWSSISDISKTPAIAQVKAYSTIIPEIWPMDVSRAWLLRQLQQWGSSKIWAPRKTLKNVRWKIMFLLKWSPFVAPPAFLKKRMSSSSFIFPQIIRVKIHENMFGKPASRKVHHRCVFVRSPP